jgi:hypothetical protein
MRVDFRWLWCSWHPAGAIDGPCAPFTGTGSVIVGNPGALSDGTDVKVERGCRYT